MERSARIRRTRARQARTRAVGQLLLFLHATLPGTAVIIGSVVGSLAAIAQSLLQLHVQDSPRPADYCSACTANPMVGLA